MQIDHEKADRLQATENSEAQAMPGNLLQGTAERNHPVAKKREET
jgi:hypothetical protein